jgi:hypothetical protein
MPKSTGVQHDASFQWLPDFPTLSGVCTHVFYHVVIKIRQLFFMTVRLPDVNPPWEWNGF